VTVSLGIVDGSYLESTEPMVLSYYGMYGRVHVSVDACVLLDLNL
jgi:hypothetical protein